MPAKLTLNEFILRSKLIHSDKYDYSNVNYINSVTPVTIICPKHGEFLQKPIHHLNGAGCPKCANNIKCTTAEFIKKAKLFHGDKYDYSKVNYIDSKTKVCVICPKHGEFWQTPNAHLCCKGCKLCRSEFLSSLFRLSIDEFILRSKLIHNNKYDYSKVNYINLQTPVTIICPRHGEFLQKPILHLKKCGCPKCKASHLELDVNNMLYTLNIPYNYRDRKTLGNGLELDFYLPTLDIAIECQGLQHFAHAGWSHYTKIEREELLKTIQMRDSIKLDVCILKNIKLLYFSNLKIKYPYPVITDINELKNIILNEIERIR